jgi:hypothetical protein
MNNPVTFYIHVLLVAAMCAGLVGCGPTSESALRGRTAAFSQLLLDDKFDEAVNYFDPDIVANRGRTTLANDWKFGVGVIKSLVTIGGRKVVGFEVRRVDFDSTKTIATAQVVYFTANTDGSDRKEHPTDQRWVIKKGAWYFSPADDDK